MLDTHALLWWIDDPRRLSRRARRAIESSERVCVATMTVLELAELFERRRIRTSVPTRAWVRDALASGVKPLPLTAEIAVDAAQLRFSNDPFDRVIYATARAEASPLVTKDELMHAFDAELAVW